ncbi:MAG: hypothetical protein E6Q89_03115 [Bacteroidia bacterium]|nr:MAG: hypothetical protein E6Q89_03115 [Bacteroidia bacterium]
MKCKNCGTHNSDQALKCQNCNAPLDGSMVESRNPTSKNHGMVVCKNCKTSNPSDALKCRNCNAPLDGSMVAEAKAKTIPGQVLCKNCKSANPADALKCMNCNAPLDGSMAIQHDKKKTPIEKSGKIDKSTTSIHHSADKQRVCPHCSYPNQATAVACVRCHTSLNIDKTPTPKAIVEGPIKPAKNKEAMGLTVNPWAEQPITPDKYHLIPLKSDFTASGEPIHLKEGNNNLNRANLDPGNTSITSNSQAVIKHAGEKWILEDTSSMKTTFVKVNGPTDLNDGDIILMGNKLFRFSKES